MSKIIMQIIKPVMDRLTPSCEVITQKVSRSMDEPLSFKERLQVRIHLMMCEFCTRYRQQLLTIRRRIQQHAEEWEEGAVPSEAHLSPEAKQRIKEKLNDDSEV